MLVLAGKFGVRLVEGIRTSNEEWICHPPLSPPGLDLRLFYFSCYKALGGWFASSGKSVVQDREGEMVLDDAHDLPKLETCTHSPLNANPKSFRWKRLDKGILSLA